MNKDFSTESFEQYKAQVLETFPELLTNIKEPLANFKKKTYEEEFLAYKKNCRPILDSIKYAYQMLESEEEKREFLAEISTAFAAKGNSIVVREPKKRQQETILVNLNLVIVVYIFPAIMDYYNEYSKPLTEMMSEKWKEVFPSTHIKTSTFEQINQGFKKKLCYITTAVCEGLGKADDCYELNLMRNYRDGFLVSEPDGEEIVKEYYDIAPTIVKRIHKNKHKQEIYEGIWTEYLAPCIRLIEEGKNKECKFVYMDMVNNLKEQYMNQ